MSILGLCVYITVSLKIMDVSTTPFEKRNMPRFAMGAISWSLQAYVMIMRCHIWCHMDIQERIHLSPQLHYFRTSFDIWISLKLHNEEFCLKLARCRCNCQPAVALIDLVTKCTARDSSKSFKKQPLYEFVLCSLVVSRLAKIGIPSSQWLAKRMRNMIDRDRPQIQKTETV